jgi:hypothetical protein
MKLHSLIDVDYPLVCLLELFFDLEDGGNKCLRKVSSFPLGHTAQIQEDSSLHSHNHDFNLSHLLKLMS